MGVRKKINKIGKKISDFVNRKKIEEELRKKRLSFYAQFVKKDDLVFDVGANVGNRVEIFLELGARVVAVEPQDVCYKILKEKFGDKIEIIKKGLAAEAGNKTMYLCDADTISTCSDDWVQLMKSGRFKNQKWDRKAEIEMTTVDELIKEFGVPVFIKIDVEGYELEVLSGLSNKVKVISYEYTVPEAADKALQCLEQAVKINEDIVCNYSITESMEFASQKWFSPEEMRKIILSNEFNWTGFGDVYLKDNS